MAGKIDKNNKLLCLVLHSHIPYVINHGTWPHGTDWLFEATAETYLPILDVLLRLEKEGLKSGLTISLTPVLVEQLHKQSFRQNFLDDERQDRASHSSPLWGFFFLLTL